MFYSLILILFILSTLKYERVFVKGYNVYKQVYKKDFSEYCRRGVVPSVFLGRKVMEANSQILQFSKLEMPYSCFISVRSESGSNIILVIEFLSHKSLISSCTKDADQLLVYGMGETYGGYWGPMADNVISQDSKNETKYYTIKTTPSYEVVDSSTENDNEFVESAIPTERLTTVHEKSPSRSVDYIEEEVPIVNVSGFLFPGVKPRPAIDIDSIFDVAYDVSFGSGMSYDTTILPLIQFSTMNDFNARRNEEVSKYRTDYNINAAPMDIDLLYPKIPTSKKRKLYKKHKYDSNKLFNFIPNNRIFKPMDTLSDLHKVRSKQHSNTIPQIDHTIKRTFTLASDFSPTGFNSEKKNSWDLIDTLLKSLNKTSNSISAEESPTSENTQELLRKISEMKHNFSVYLSPNISTYKEQSKVISNQDYVTRIPTIVNIGFYQQPFPASEMSSTQSTIPKTLIIRNSSVHRSVSFENITETYSNYKLETKSLSTMNNNVNITKQNDSDIQIEDSDFINVNTGYNAERNILIKDTYNSTRPPVSSFTKPLRGSLVDRESWENIVQIAPVMADILNVVNSNKTERIKMNNTRRRKKHIESISIDMAKPHKITSRKERCTTTTSSHNKADIQEFAELVELQDDEMQSRVALRYLRHYIGPVLFNVCDYEEALTRHVYLFNSSRIVLAISNFTIDTMTLVVTPTRTLLTSEERCTLSQFECQVSGARVCIDSLTACDGVPNCGSYDVYDEDRLMCGGATGLQHNVCLAAFTILAVLLTSLYTIHYWLKRCVPKVSDAFFIYTEGCENMLYLDSIMRNPNDDDDNSKSLYQRNIFEVDLMCPVVHEESKEKPILKVIKRIFVICSCFLYKGKSNEKSEENNNTSHVEPKRTYSFTELEIRKMLCNNLTETGVQTGDSLEMAPLNKRIKSDDHVTDDKFDKSDSLLVLNSTSLNTSLTQKQKTNPDELSVMKFLNHSRSSTTQQSNTTLKTKTSNLGSTTPDEKEIQSHVYEQQNRNIPSTSTAGVILTNIDIHMDNIPPNQTKHLRFEEGATMIPADYHNDNGDIDNVNKPDRRRSVVLGTGRSWNTTNLDAIEEVHQQGPSGTNRDYIRFWSKSRRPKKPHS